MNAGRNIALLFIIKAAKWFMLYMPVSFLFYLENGFGRQEYLLLHAVYSGVIAFLEVPSGYIADVWGRKPAIAAGTFIGTIGFGIYSLTGSLPGFLLAEVFLGAGQSILSGADTALLYDSLKEEKRETEYLKIEGRITATGNISESLAGIFVSLVLLKLYRHYFLLQTFLAFTAFIAALFLFEPARSEREKKAGFGDILDIVNNTLRKKRALRNFILFSSVVGFASLSLAWLAQPVFYEIGLDKKYFGIAWVGLNLAVALGSISSPSINSKFGLKVSIISMGIALSAGFVAVGADLNLSALLILILLFYVRGTAHPMLKNYINLHTDSSQRATVFSLRSLIIRILFFSLGPLLGFISDKFSLRFALTLCGISVFIPAMVLAGMIIRGRDR